MTTHTDVQIINNAAGIPEFAVVPYSHYLSLINKKQINLDNAIPEEVAKLALENDISASHAWRMHLGLSQAEVAKRIGISQSAYAQYEKSNRLRKTTLIKVAKALNLNFEQLNF